LHKPPWKQTGLCNVALGEVGRRGRRDSGELQRRGRPGTGVGCPGDRLRSIWGSSRGRGAAGNGAWLRPAAVAARAYAPAKGRRGLDDTRAGGVEWVLGKVPEQSGGSRSEWRGGSAGAAPAGVRLRARRRARPLNRRREGAVQLPVLAVKGTLALKPRTVASLGRNT
jgi:hypothetical protein